MLRVYDEFAGVGGTSHGASYVPGVEIYAAANHDKHAVDSHTLNFPGARHFQADITKLPVDKMPYAELFSASPACPAWTDANGVRRDFDRANAEVQTLFEVAETEPDPKLKKRLEEYKRSRLLMKEVPRYLRAMIERGKPVLAGMMENVIQCRKWHEWDDWFNEIVKLGYEIRIIAFNSMHAQPVRSLQAPQSRDRLYLAYWHKSLGRRPDFDKWLRPHAWCPSCDEQVQAVQVFKKPGNDMGRYQQQYVYVCPRVSCRGQLLRPETLPALAAIDPTIPGTRIGDRAKLKMDPLAEATLDRIRAGVRRYWAPLMVPVEGRDGKKALPASEPLRTQTCRNETGFAFPPFLAPAGGTWRDKPTSSLDPMPTRTTRECDGVASLPPFITPLRGGGDKERARSVQDPLTTVTASGNHHGLALPPLVMRNNTARGDAGYLSTPATEPVRSITTAGHQSLLVPYYGASTSAIPASGPIGTLTTKDKYAVATPDLDALASGLDLDDVLFRMLEPHEIARAMAFDPSYQTSVKDKRTKVKLFGNAVTAPVAEVIMSALVECITGEDLDRFVEPRELAVSA
ncbi:DNA (cytosine-5)-methyltransferase 1 [Actinoplanes campanulatus]|uniref:DNA (cytosine-5-)-methyltransferase n=1 Tax=Actinoplanes campanulatus TaxID=113559 RepID=A0A7W5AMB9_9ACTN|nr:DNA cytosine methyltransferase [Actinoplanes campanulatus]MBB3098923.1 DNA (cytosine-5)-methyltransferase 1 [Actinoplanes campanulatus]GGN39829.1 DNA cytosine methyltransferase [Actinoplanes campanulatus]GID40127.1 DNA cytosine methyltransferase [Actinoplanes campanulatus]